MAIGCTGHSWQTAACAGAGDRCEGHHLRCQDLALIGLKVLTDPKIPGKMPKAEFDKAMAGKNIMPHHLRHVGPVNCIHTIQKGPGIPAPFPSAPQALYQPVEAGMPQAWYLA